LNLKKQKYFSPLKIHFMSNQDFHVKITTSLSPVEAMKNISRVDAWWVTDFEGRAEKSGDVFTTHFGDAYVTFTITEMLPGEKVDWLVTDCYLPWLTNKQEWTNTTMTWLVQEKKNVTDIDFTHHGLVPEIECYDSCVKGWNFYITESLSKLMTEGKGLPQAAKRTNEPVQS
jgi:hypothetical protein